MAQIAEILDILEPLSIKEKEEVILEFFKRIALLGGMANQKEKAARMLEHRTAGAQ